MKKSMFYKLNLVCVLFCFFTSLAVAGQYNQEVISNKKTTTNHQIRTNKLDLSTSGKRLRSAARVPVLSGAQVHVTPPSEISVFIWDGNMHPQISGVGSIHSYIQNNTLFYKDIQMTLECPTGSSSIEASIYGTYGSAAPQATQPRSFTNLVAGQNNVSVATQWTVPLATGSALWDNFCNMPICETISNPLLVEVSCLNNAAVLSKKNTVVPYSIKVSCCAEPIGVSPKSSACFGRI